MDYTTQVIDSDKEKQWRDFTSTGSIASYLIYKDSKTEPNEINTQEKTAIQGGAELGSD